MSDSIESAAPAAEHFGRAVALHQQGRDGEALVACEAALDAETSDARLWQLTGVVRARLGLLDESADAFARAVELEPNDAMLRFQQSSVFLKAERKDEAMAALETLVAIDPGHVEALRVLAALKREHGEIDAAIEHYEALLRLRPDDTAAWTLLGWCRAARYEFGHAEACYRRAAVTAPDSAAAHIAHAGALRNVGDAEAALAAAERAVAIAPDDPAAHDARAAALRELGRTVEGLAATERALALDPDHADALLHAGLLLDDAGDPAAATIAFRRAIALKPDNVDAHWNSGAALLALGRFKEGFAEYEWRLRSPLFYRGKPRHSQPRWDGSPLAGRTLLVHGEQGLGDTIQFLRYVPLIAARGASIVLEVQPPLLALARTAVLVPAVYGTGDALPPFDLRASLMSLPHLTGTFPGDAALPMPYLRAEPARIEKWAQRLDRLPWPRVGLAWHGNPKNPRDAQRSIALAALIDLFELPVTFVSLQPRDAATEIAEAELAASIEDWSDELDRDGAFIDSAALMMSLDAIVTVDTAIAHLAGALGRPAMLLLPKNPDFRWMLGRRDTPWYPSLTLLRQEKAGDWSGPIESVRQALWRLVANG